MNKHIQIHKLTILCVVIIIISGCMTIREPQNPRKTGVNKKDEKITSNTAFEEHPVLRSIYEAHEIDQLPGIAGDKFVNLYLLTLKEEYLPIGNRTFCTKFFYDYFTELGYSELLEKIKTAKGTNMVEKTMNYAEETGEISILLSGHEAQKLANKGRDVGVLGEYFYDKAEKLYTVHYSVVQASNIAFDDEGKMVPYWVTGLISKRKDANDRYGTGTFLAQAGIANGLIDFRWAYNAKLNGILQKDSKGNFRGGIIFVVFPEKRIPMLGIADMPIYYLTVNTEPPDARVYVDGVFRGTGPCRILLLRKGERSVTVTYPGYKDMQKQITLGEMKEPALNVKLEEQKGSIHITTTPEKAKVFINGKQSGISPCVIPGLPVGEYQVSIQLPGYVSVSKIITVEQDTQSDVSSVLDKYEMIQVPGGSFQQGGPGNLPVHSVRVNDFLISKYEVTCEQYESFCVDTGRPWPGTGEWGYRSRPITGVDWYDAIEYCNWLSRKEGFAPYYEINRGEPDPDNKNENDKKRWTIVYNRDADGYRLPTETEWEYAAKGGTSSQGYTYAGGNEIDQVAWYNENSGKNIQPVGQKKPNELGIYDMSGNAWEWCGDWFHEKYYEQSPEENPPGPGAGMYRVRRGGSSYNADDENMYLCTVTRNSQEPDHMSAYTGFRVVRRVAAKKTGK